VAELLFYVLGALALAAALGVVFSKSPMMSVLSLLASFFALSVIYLLAGMQFMAAVQILVYAGAILVLFLFVIMLLNLGDVRTGTGTGTGPEPGTGSGSGSGTRVGSVLRTRRARVAAALALAIGVMGLIAAQRSTLEPVDAAASGAGIDDISALAGELFGHYGLVLEAAGMLLLATMIAVIVLAKRQRRAEGRP